MVIKRFNPITRAWPGPMAHPGSRSSTWSGVPLSMPPPRASTASRGAVPNRLQQFVMPRFVGVGRQESFGVDEETVADLQGSRVSPSTGLGGGLPHGFCVDRPDEDIQEEYSGIFFSTCYLSHLCLKIWWKKGAVLAKFD
jgi:hypothetical protein